MDRTQMEQRVWVLREPKAAVTVYKRPLGPRGQYAGVTLSAADQSEPQIERHFLPRHVELMHSL